VKYTITLENSGGVLDTVHAETAEEACAAAVRLLSDTGVLYDGDVLRVVGPEDRT